MPAAVICVTLRRSDCHCQSGTYGVAFHSTVSYVTSRIGSPVTSPFPLECLRAGAMLRLDPRFTCPPQH